MPTNPWEQTLDTASNGSVGLLNPATPPATTQSLTPTSTTTATGDKANQITTPPTYTATGFTAKTRTPEANETVAGQFNDLIKSDNPLIKMGRTMAKQQMNAKGLLNSSMAIGAADAAAYQTALPIAQQDAKTFSDAAMNNQNATNQSLQSNANSLNDAGKINLTAWTDVAKSNLDAASKSTLANIQANYQTLVQANQSASDMYSKTMQNITDIANNKDLLPEAKNSAVQTQLSMLETSLAMVGKLNALNLGDILTFNYNTTTGGVSNTGTAGQ